jgi:ribosomal protein S18 acetylase RimI-like enzyme
MEVVRVTPVDWQRVRDMRLRALLDAPDAFGSTYAEEAKRDEEGWRAWSTGWSGAADQALFAAEDERWVGIALGVRWEEDPKVVHLYAMWVDPSSRRRGAGRALVDAVGAWTRDLGIDRIVLRVTEGNAAAVALYEGCGFVDTEEREPLRDGSGAATVVMQRLE